jgi:hypothetical protein
MGLVPGTYLVLDDRNKPFVQAACPFIVCTTSDAHDVQCAHSDLAYLECFHP